MARDLASLTEELAAALERANVPYAIGGALAMASWGFPRTTRDLDVNVFVDEEGLAPVLTALEEIGCAVSREAATRSAAERGDFTVLADGVRVDVFTSFHPFHEQAAMRRVAVALPSGRTVHVLSAEDLIVFKTLFGRTKDFADIERIAAGRGDLLDRAHVRRWLEQLLPADDPRVERVLEILGN